MGGLLCPNPGCGEGLLPDDGGTRVQCPEVPNGCGVSVVHMLLHSSSIPFFSSSLSHSPPLPHYSLQFIFCRVCRRSYHQGPCQRTTPETSLGQAYPVDAHHFERAQWIAATERFIQNNTNIKPCPRCQAPIEKNGKEYKSHLLTHAQFCDEGGGGCGF